MLHPSGSCNARILKRCRRPPAGTWNVEREWWTWWGFGSLRLGRTSGSLLSHRSLWISAHSLLWYRLLPGLVWQIGIVLVLHTGWDVTGQRTCGCRPLLSWVLLLWGRTIQYGEIQVWLCLVLPGFGDLLSACLCMYVVWSWGFDAEWLSLIDKGYVELVSFHRVHLIVQYGWELWLSSLRLFVGLVCVSWLFELWWVVDRMPARCWEPCMFSMTRGHLVHLGKCAAHLCVCDFQS